MPKETFWNADQAETDTKPALEVRLGDKDFPNIRIGDLVSSDRAGLNRLIKILKRARNQTYGKEA